MIRDAVIHIINEQPLRVDLYRMPVTTDVSLACTNLRTLSGKRPVFADDMASYFLFPLHYIRFIEILPQSMRDIPAGSDGTLALPAGTSRPGDATSATEHPRAASPEAEIEIDEDFLRRVRDV